MTDSQERWIRVAPQASGVAVQPAGKNVVEFDNASTRGPTVVSVTAGDATSGKVIGISIEARTLAHTHTITPASKVTP